ncbi:MAG: hypothetical protein M1826_000220 [Phylliscum demangeonii]|nr:MAG: hypothetical protein M1826_000220 [Phylliscum demangeonii]
MPSPSVDYYAILEISPSATPQQIRDGYKKAALKSHPDRVPAGSPERPARTRRFQLINDAYYTLSDATRRRDYDRMRPFRNFQPGPTAPDDTGAAYEPTPPPASATSSSSYSFPWSAFGFGSAKRDDDGTTPQSNAQFASVFEEMLRDEGLAEGQHARPTGRFWSLVGGFSGGAMGFIVANLPGAVAGAMAGNRLGAVRDTRGKSVYDVFQQLDPGAKAKLLSELAAKVFAHAVSS